MHELCISIAKSALQVTNTGRRKKTEEMMRVNSDFGFEAKRLWQCAKKLKHDGVV